MIKDKSTFNNLEEHEYPLVWRKIVDELEIDILKVREPITKKEYLTQINQWIFDENNLHTTNKELHGFIKSIFQEIEEMRLDSRELDWLDPKDDRQCYWIWMKIREFTIDPPHQDQARPVTPYFSSFIPYNEYKFPHQTSSTALRYDIIHRFFLRHQALKHEKSELSANLERKWSYLASIESFNWVSTKDVKQVEWLINYIDNHQDIQSSVSNTLDPKSRILAERLNLAIYQFDNWNVSPADKQLLIIKMKRAWSQKKHRDKLEGRKAYSVVMSTDVKSKLDEMANKQGCHRNTLLEKIINDSYNIFKGIGSRW
ncbi:hypothetical protein QFW85_26670 [Vibrio chagasii]|uniref:hypothetical protein n=1 Tax=Vibrio chagasii TaxID=170679 RepID=UPI003DA7D141